MDLGYQVPIYWILKKTTRITWKTIKAAITSRDALRGVARFILVFITTRKSYDKSSPCHLFWTEEREGKRRRGTDFASP